MSKVYGFGKSNKRATLTDKFHTSPEYSEIRETFKRVSQLKNGNVDNKKPVSYHMSKKLTENRRRN
jgi:hypothetical protein